MAEEIQIFKIPGGVDNLHSEDALSEGTARKVLNSDIFSDGSPKLRKGYAKLMDLTNASSLFSNDKITLLVNNGALCQYINNTLISLVAVSGPVVYSDIDGVIYFSDGDFLGRIVNEAYKPGWVSNPSGSPSLAKLNSGSLAPGKYQIAITHIDEQGMESGTDIGATIEIESGSIIVSNIPQNPDAAYSRIYMTVANGTEFYRQLDTPMGNQSATISAHLLGGSLQTQFASAMIGGDILEYHYGRLYVAVGNTLMYSESLRPGLTRTMDNYFPAFDSDIRLVMHHTTGLFVSTGGGVFFIPGGDPANASIRKVSDISGIMGTAVNVAASLLGLEQTGVIPIFLSENGYVACGADGHIMPLNEKNLVVDEAKSGSSIFREEDGIRSIVTSLQNPGEGSNVGVQDSISFEVRRNGVIIPA